MIVTVEWMKKKFQEFNKKYWNGEIETPVFKTSRSEHLFGQALCNIDRRTWKTHDYALKMSIYYDQPEHYLEETLLHEMIHLYEYQTRPHIFKYKFYNCHGWFFKKEADRINADGYNIQKFVQEEKSAACKLTERSQKLLDRKKQVGYSIALCKCKGQNVYHAYKINDIQIKKDFPDFCKRTWAKSIYEEYTIYHTSYEEFLKIRCSVRAYYVLDDNMVKGIRNEGTIIKTKAIG